MPWKPARFLIVKKKIKVIIANLISLFLLLAFSIGCYIYVFRHGRLFAQPGRDSALQFMYFIPFIQKAFLAGQPFWSWSYGLGGDVFGQFSYYYTTSPFFYLMLLVRALGIGSWTLGDTLHWKLFFSIFKQFLAMSLMYSLLKYEGKKTYTSLIGALVYGGSLCFMWFALMFDFMTDAYIWLPLTILGFRRHQKTGKWLLFVVSAAFTAANSFYFGFVSYVFYTIFILVSVKASGQTAKEKITAYLHNVLKYAAFDLMALALAAVAFVPSVLAFLNTDRFSTIVKMPLLYDSRFFLQLPERLFSYTDLLGFPIIALLILFLPWKQLSSITRQKTILAGLFTLLYLTPYTGSVFNGLSYTVPRWLYLFIFAVAYALPDWLEENDRQKRFGLYCFAVMALFIGYSYYTKGVRASDFIIINNSLTTLIRRVVLVLNVVSLLLLALRKYLKRRSAIIVLNYALVLCIMSGLLINNNVYLYTLKPFMTSSVLQTSGLDNKEEQQIFRQITPSRNEFYRSVFRNSSIVQMNSAMNYGFYGASAYSSMIDGNLHRWLRVDHNILVPGVSPSYYDNFDDRQFLQAAFAVKYVVTPKTSPISPYGFKLISETAHYLIYENQHDLGLDLWYNSTTDRQTYANLNVAQRDALLLQTAVVDHKIAGLTNYQPRNITTELSLNWAQMKTENAEFKGGILKAGKNAYLYLPIVNRPKPANGEILFKMTIKPRQGQTVILNINGKSTRKMYESYPYTYPLSDYVFRLDGNTNLLKINISAGEYKISNVHAWFNSYQHYQSLINDRNRYNLQSLYVNGGQVRGLITNREKGIVALNIPFDKGWSATVDGQKQPLIKVNGVFSGLVLKPGIHNIALSYLTPGLVPGAGISVLTLVMIIALSIRTRKRRTPLDLPAIYDL
ncbi:MAG TPA: YfhO family protein [Desulfobacteria bacterium]|nr:YfhO family protein [Desulfobacteria bacterium]